MEITIAKKIKNIILNESQKDTIEIKEDMNLIDDLEFDSVAIINLIITLENEFGFEFQDFEQLIDVIDNVGKFIDYIERLIRENKK